MDLTGDIKNQSLYSLDFFHFVIFFSTFDLWLLENLGREYLKKLFLSKNMHRKFQLHTKKAELFNIIWKLHPSCDSATLQQYP